jgi:WD40 repeat protein
MMELADGRKRIFPRVADGIDLVDLSSGQRTRFAIPTDRIDTLAFSPDGKIVAAAGGWRQPMIRLYRTDNGREIDAFTCPATRTYPGALAFSPDGRSLAAGLDDTTVLIWDVRHGR